MNLRTYEVILLIVLSFFGSSVLWSAASAAVGVSPEKLEFEEAGTQTLLIQNLNPDPVLITIQTREKNGLIELSSERFTLSAGAEEEVKVTLKAKKRVNGEILITAKETSSNLAVQSGIKIPINSKGEQWPSFLVGGLSLAALSVWLVWRRQAARSGS